MAKATPGKANEFEDIKMPRKGKKVVRWIIVLLVLLMLIGAGVAVFVFNVWNIRDDYLYEPLSGLPWVGQFMPTPEFVEEEVLPTIEELEAIIQNYRQSLSSAEATAVTLNELNGLQAQEIIRLSEFEAQHNAFNAMREEFDRMLAEGDPRAFAQFFAEMNPETQAELYSEIRGGLVIDDQLNDLFLLYENMNTRAATDALEAMIGPNTTLVIDILNGLSLATRSSIVQNMTVDNRVIVTNLLAP